MEFSRARTPTAHQINGNPRQSSTESLREMAGMLTPIPACATLPILC